MKSGITSFGLRYKFCTACVIYLSEILWLETEVTKNVQEGTHIMLAFRKCNESLGTELGCAGKRMQLVITGFNNLLSIFLVYI